MRDFIPCRTCAKTEMPGYKRTFKTYNGRQYPVWEKCSCLRRWQQAKLLEGYVREAGLRPSLVDANKPYDPETDYRGTQSISSVRKLQRYVDEVDTPTYAYQSLYLYGPYNTQKTTLAQWAAIELIKKGKRVQYTLMRTLLNALVDEQHSWSDADATVGRSRRDLLKKVEASDILVLDESFDKQKMTMYKSGYQLPFLDEFLRQRIDMYEKPVIFISNVPIDSIDEQFASLRNLVDRRIAKRGAALPFYDDYTKVSNDFDITDIFA